VLGFIVVGKAVALRTGVGSFRALPPAFSPVHDAMGKWNK